jgi:hypothetical protein
MSNYTPNKLDDIHETDKFLDRLKLSKPTQEESKST